MRNCKGTSCPQEETEHSLECQAEYIAAVTGGKFISSAKLAQQKIEMTEEELRKDFEEFMHECFGNQFSLKQYPRFKARTGRYVHYKVECMYEVWRASHKKYDGQESGQAQ